MTSTTNRQQILSNELYVPATEAGIELRLALTDINLLKLKAKLMSISSNIYDKTIGSNLPEDRKQSNYELATTLIDCKKVIDHFEQLDMKRQQRNSLLIIRCQTMENEITRLKEENNHLKERIP